MVFFCLHLHILFAHNTIHTSRDRERPSIDTLERILCLCARPHSFWMKHTRLCVIEKLFTMPQINRKDTKKEKRQRKSNYTHRSQMRAIFNFNSFAHSFVHSLVCLLLLRFSSVRIGTLISLSAVRQAFTHLSARALTHARALSQSSHSHTESRSTRKSLHTA